MVEFRKLFAEDGGRFFALRGKKKSSEESFRWRGLYMPVGWTTTLLWL